MLFLFSVFLFLVPGQGAAPGWGFLPVASHSSRCGTALCNGGCLAALMLWLAYAPCPVTLLEKEIIKG